MPFDPSHTQGENDCFRCCMACLLDIHPSRVKFIKPNEQKGDFFYTEWQLYCNERFNKYLDYNRDIDELLNSDEKWIAVVWTKEPTISRAIVMKGAKLYYEPGKVRKQKPKKFLQGISLRDIA